MLKDAGQAVVSYSKYGDYKNDNILNFFGDHIFYLIQEKSNFKVKRCIKILLEFIYTTISMPRTYG